MKTTPWANNTDLKDIFDNLTPHEKGNPEVLEHIIKTRIGIDLNRRTITVPREYDPYMGNLKCKQYPSELAQFMAFLYERRHSIRNYLEIGTERCGTFFVIDSYLRSVNPDFQKSIALDIRAEPRHFDAYRQLYDCEYICCDKSKYRVPAFTDLIFIDASHSFESVTADYEATHMHCRYAAFHDIALKHVPGVEVHRFWNSVKSNHRHFEFLNTDAVLPDAVGIGVIDFSDVKSIISRVTTR